MNRKIILPLLVASAVVGCLSVQIKLAEGGDSFSPGFLLYLPGNLEAGSTTTAYIETNFTDPFEARLNFQSNRGQHFYGAARIVNGSGVVEFTVPDVDYWYGTVNFTGIMEGSRQMFTSPDNNYIYIYQQSQKVTFIETDKPLYKPGQEVKFRLLTIDSQFKPDTSNITKIQIESPSQIRLAQWRDVERPEGLVDLSFQLVSEPVLGQYMIKAYINDAWVTQPFKVEEYVLPKVDVTVNAPSFVLITAEEYSFQVCAKYTYGQPVRGSVSGEVGKLSRDYYYYYFRRLGNPQLGGDQEEPDVELTDAVPFSGQLNSEGCLESSVSGLNLSSYGTPYYQYSLAVRATVVEATTGDEFTEAVDATQLEVVPINIALESPESFKPGIPYQGRIKVTYPDGKPAPNEELNITATVDRKTAYSAYHTSNLEGILEFEIPYAVVDKSISLQVSSDKYPYQSNPYGYSIYSPTSHFNLDPSFSPTGRYLQIAPIFNSVNAGDELTFQVLYTSDDDSVSSDFKVQFVSRNKLMDAGATQEGEIRRRRAVELDAQEPLTECQRQAQEAEEKGDQSSFIPLCDEDGSFTRQQCMMSTDRCWCVDPENGREIPLTSRQPPEEYLDCEVTEDEGPIEVPIGELGPPDVFNECPEGFKFGDGVKTCVRETECERQVREVRGKGLLGGRTPDCDEDGNFMLEQCHGSTGYCWCVDIVTGLELPGTKTGPTENNTDCEAFIASQETECQRQAREATEKGLLGGRTPDCDEDGNFMLEQCHGSTGYCWCVDIVTGLELPETKTGPTENNTDCEAFIASQESECQRQAREAEEKGLLLGGRRPDCDEDGNFMLEQCHGSTGYCWCVDIVTGLELPETKTGPTEDNTDCEAFIASQETECQRQAREATEKGLLGGRTPDCDEDGNFMLEQCHGSTGYCWCVDIVTGLELPETKTGPTEDNTDCEAFTASQETECERQAREAKGKGLLLGGRRPDCDEDGNFMPEQCHGSSGYCWCVDILTGLEIPDTKTGPTEDNVDCEAVTPPPPPKPSTLAAFTLPILTQEPIVHVDPQALHEVSFSVPITAGMSPEAKLLVYYTSPEGEVVADSINIKINEAFENEVKLEFLEPEVLPGSKTTLKVSAENGSLCGIGIVDKSVYVLGGENKVTPKKLFSSFDLSVRRTYSDSDCPSGWFRYRKKRSIIYPGYGYNTVHYVDSSVAFSNAGLKTITNYDLSVAPCVFEEQIVAFLGRSDGVIAESGVNTGAPQTAKEDKVRSYFPSTWLWTLQRISDMEVEVPLTVPHTITDWIANGLCTNIEKGLGVSPPVVLRAFQPFFLSMSLPYSIIRTEKTPIKVSVFNYLEQCLVVRVTLEENEDFVLSGPNEYTVAVPAGAATTVTYKVAAFVLGSIPLQVSAESIIDDEFLCGNEAVAGPAGSSDAVRRDLKVKPEGEPETTSESAYFCLEEDGTYNKHVSLKIPPQHVPGTAVGEITVTGDLVGNTLSNVESMLRMPYGCGEQNLVSMVPNIVALQYLQSVGEATPEITAEAKKYILSGYQRELNYRRDDNSYSAFGNSNPSGSTFLTAFVVRTYAHAQKFVDIDEEDLNVTIEWLRSIQNEDGSFMTVGYLAHKAMKGGVNNNVTLAAYMVATFLEAGYDSQDKTVAAALAYLDSKLDTLEDTYSMALLAYAYALAGSDHFDVVYQMLQESAVESEGMKHWESNREDLPAYTNYYRDSSKAQNIEMTAYVLRAMVFKQVPNLEVEGSIIARWLVAQRNPRGGFSSTQDTVIGLTALAEFSALGTSENSELTLTMNVRGGSTLQFDIDYDNRFILQKGSFDSFPAEISVSAEGQGCALYSISGDYYIKREKQTLDPFTLDVKTKGQKPKARKRRDAHGSEEQEYEEESTCDRFTISISTRYNGEDGASNMAIINFRPVSGFVFDKESLEALIKEYDFVKRYEINEDIITFYFDEITNEDFEFEFDVTKEFDVEDAKPAFITILDYYENGLKVAEEIEFVCPDEGPTSSPSTTYTTPPSPSGFASSSSTVTPDYDECAVPDVCGGPEYQCVNYPGTYECICAEGYALDEEEENCVEVPSCPVCNGGGLPLGVDDLICASDFIHVMKILPGEKVRPLNDLVTNTFIKEKIKYKFEINEACTCDLLANGDRIIVVASNNHISPSPGATDETLLLDEDVLVVESLSSIKKDIAKVLMGC